MSKDLFIVQRYLYTAAFIISCCFVCSCENDKADIDKVFGTKDLSREEATDIESYFSQEGKLRAKVTSPLMLRMKIVDTQLIEFPNTVKADFYNDSTGQVESWVTSRYGKYYEDYNKVYLRDSVVVITTGGDTLKSADLWWDQNKGIFYTYNYAEYRGKDQTVDGHGGMEATQDLKNVTFKKPTAVLQMSEGF